MFCLLNFYYYQQVIVVETVILIKYINRKYKATKNIKVARRKILLGTLDCPHYRPRIIMIITEYIYHNFNIIIHITVKRYIIKGILPSSSSSSHARSASCWDTMQPSKKKSHRNNNKKLFYQYDLDKTVTVTNLHICKYIATDSCLYAYLLTYQQLTKCQSQMIFPTNLSYYYSDNNHAVQIQPLTEILFCKYQTMIYVILKHECMNVSTTTTT